MTPHQPARSSSAYRPGLIVLLLGVVIGLAYTFVIKPTQLWGIGAPADIGGGLIPLASIVLTVTGLVMLIRSRFSRH